MSTIFYHLDSSGPESNLQLFSLLRAIQEREQLIKDESSLTPSQVRERCAFIVNALGLSLSQLLGQNVPSTTERIQDPRTLLRRLLDDANLASEDVTRLSESAGRLWDFYEAIRHFGQTPNETKYDKLSELTSSTTEELVELTLEIWNVVIVRAKAKTPGDLDEFTTIENAIEELNDLHESPHTT